LQRLVDVGEIDALLEHLVAVHLGEEWGTLGMNVVSIIPISGRLLAASRNFSVFSARNPMSFEARSSSTIDTPPDVPTPGMEGGGKRNARAPGKPAIRALTLLKIASNCSSVCLRSCHGSSEMKKRAL